MQNEECRITRIVLLVALVFWAQTGLTANAGEVRVRVDASSVVRIVDARHFGINAVMWDSYFDTPETFAALRELDVQALRFPGGSPSDDYHWEFNRNGRNLWHWATPFSSFIHIATNLHAQVFITVNYGSGTPEEAAAWVRCANITNHCGFKYWEIGNESYGAWEHDQNSPRHDPVTYARRAKEFFSQMKAADPHDQDRRGRHRELQGESRRPAGRS